MPQILKVPFSPSSSGHKPVWKWQQRSSATCGASWHRGKGTVSRHVGTAAGGHTQGRQGPVDGLHLQFCAIQMLMSIETRELSDSRRKQLFQKILSRVVKAPGATRLCGYFGCYLGCYWAIQCQRKPQNDPHSLFRPLLNSTAALLTPECLLGFLCSRKKLSFSLQHTYLNLLLPIVTLNIFTKKKKKKEYETLIRQ